jgi:STE24 endopeptidase
VILLIGAGCAAYLLLPSAVPSDLELPHVDLDSAFGAGNVADGVSFERVENLLWIGNQIVLLATLALYAVFGIRFTRESAAGRIGTGMLLGMLGLALVWLSQLPLGLVQHWWERKHDLASDGYLTWAFAGWAELGTAFVFVCVALLIVMALAGPLGDNWWIPGSAVFVGLFALFSFITPYLATTGQETHTLRDPALVASAERFEKAQGLESVPIDVTEVSDFTTQANAFASGFGPTRRIVLWDTLLDGRFSTGEVEVVMAHELGHISSEHIAKGIGWYALFAIPGAYLVALATRRRGGMRAAEAVPLALLVVVVLQIAALPVQAWLTRRMEMEADWKALESSRDPASMERLFHSFAETSLSDPSPPTWAYVLLEDHPTLEQRVAMARAWVDRGGQPIAPVDSEPTAGPAPASIRVLPGAATTIDLSAYQAYEVAVASGEVQRLHSSHAVEYEPSRSVTGRLVYVSDADGDAEIYTARPDGSASRRLTDADETDYDPAWSRDGERIAWVRLRGDKGRIWTMRADGTDPIMLPGPGDAQNPRWSPDGRTIAFWADDGDIGSTWVVGTDGQGLRMIGAGSYPSWAPDGRRLVVETAGGLVVIRLDGTRRQVVEGTEEGDGQPAWSPSGDQIVFVSTRDDEYGDLWTVAPAGGKPEQLTVG